jgi:hypothetical protein
MSVYQLWVIKNQPFSMNYAALSAAQQQELWAQEEASIKRAGAVNLLGCDSIWANEAYASWGITQFPDVAARIQHTSDLVKAGWFRIIDSFSILGIPMVEPKEIPFPDPIFQLWVVRSNPAATDFRSRLSKEEEAAMWKTHDEALGRDKSFAWLVCDSYWSDDQYSAFGVNVYPNIEAEIYHKAELAKIHWEKYFDSFTILGTRSM